jgi:hypothetical protein
LRRARADEQGDPYAVYVPQWTAFLDQARWLLEQQQRRGTGFQQTAVALIGFDGVLLAVLVSGDALGHVTRYHVAWWATVIGAAFLVLSAVAAVMTILPRATNAVGAGDTFGAWKKLKENGSWDRANQHFAEMLLNPSPEPEEPKSRWARLARQWCAWLRLPEPPLQPLEAATHLATVRGRWTTGSAWSLVVGLASLAAALIAAP